MALTASDAEEPAAEVFGLPSGEVKRSGSIPTWTSRTAASPKIAAVTSMPNMPTITVTPASRAGALTCARLVGGSEEQTIATTNRIPA